MHNLKQTVPGEQIGRRDEQRQPEEYREKPTHGDFGLLEYYP